MEHQDREQVASRRNGLPRSSSNQLVITHEGRKPLFAGAANARDKAAVGVKGNKAQASPRIAATDVAVGGKQGSELTRRTKSDSRPSSLPHRRDGAGANSANSANSAYNSLDNSGSGSGSGSRSSPGGTRIPRPLSMFNHRRGPFSMSEALEVANEEIGPIDGSPSPAPRQWRSKGAHGESELRPMSNQDRPNIKTRNAPGSAASKPTAQFAASRPQRSSANEIENAVPQANANRRPDGHAIPSDDDGINSVLPELVPGIEDIPLPSVETAAERKPAPSPRHRIPITSPEKSFDWQVENDFTAGDLQVSDSPRIKVGSNRPFAHRPSLVGGAGGVSPLKSPTKLTHPGWGNMKLEEIRVRELRLAGSEVAEPRRGSSKLDEIRAREKEVEEQIPVPDRSKPRPKNLRLDEIRQREAQGLSKRAYAAARLEEIREQNSMSRSVSPEEARSQQSNPEQRRQEPNGQHQPQQGMAVSGGVEGTDRGADRETGPPTETSGERIPDTPVTVFRSQRAADGRSNGTAPRRESTDAGADDDKHGDSRDLLRRLARAASASPATETEANVGPQPPPPRRVPRDDGEARPKLAAQARPPEKSSRRPKARDNDGAKPTVGFMRLRREDSSGSMKSRTSSVNSEVDPTDRIEAEIRLFAPHDNQSERGSVRAPSPAPDSDSSGGESSDGLTPKPQAHDQPSMPTPRVTGAYVETPTTAKVERRRDDWRVRANGDTVWGAESADRAPRGSRDQDTASDPGTSDHNRGANAAALRKRRRARSLPRRRLPLKNSAKLPSAKGDLFELLRGQNIDDSTLDDFAEGLTGRKKAGQSVKAEAEPTPPVKCDDGAEGDENRPVPDAQLTRLYSGLVNIRSAKQGIEWLEDWVSHASSVRQHDDDDSDDDGDDDDDDAKPKLGLEEKGSKCGQEHEHRPSCQTCPEAPAVTYVRLPVPRLYRSTPEFQLTLAGLVLLVALLWLAAESAACALYCRPTSCSPAADCVFSFDDPNFGQALPVKLDQWVLGRRGRELLTRAAEEALDWVADMEDLALGRSISEVTTQGMTFAQKRQHRRRLAKRGLPPRLGAGPAPGPDPDPPPPPEQRARWEAWRWTPAGREQAHGTRNGDHAVRDEAGAIEDDERVG